MKLEYSPLTDKVYITSANGSKKETTQNFLQIMLLWFHETSPEMKSGQKWERSLREKETSKVLWRFRIEKEPALSEESNQDELWNSIYREVSDSIFLSTPTVKKEEVINNLAQTYSITRK